MPAGKDVFPVDHGRGSLDAASATQEAMQRAAEVIYQAVFVDDGWLGLADFVERVERPSALGSFSYEVADTKLTWTGTHERASFRVRDFDAYAADDCDPR